MLQVLPCLNVVCQGSVSVCIILSLFVIELYIHEYDVGGSVYVECCFLIVDTVIVILLIVIRIRTIYIY
jgi:hypothetical protein